ncbi:MAG: peptidoglycan DD-metalloendopeptidase family protein [Gammaproteobacteria bacterium]|nr:peptidoglycan DD-metalloendopeptidase family protein [Gammaproteobacteria bacterium]
MKLIFVDEHHGQTKTIVLRGWLKGVLSVCLIIAPASFGYLGYQLSSSDEEIVFSEKSARNWERELKSQTEQLKEIKKDSEQQIEALTLRLAVLQARLTRLDAMGSRITEVSGLGGGEFDFTSNVGVGGPAITLEESIEKHSFIQILDQFERQLTDRQNQLEILEGLMSDRKTRSDVFIAGRPVDDGWIASGYGKRPDPFTGQMSFHSGIDFTTGKSGTDINTIGAGVVTWSGPKSRYGLMVEVNHGNGFATRYAHAQELFVNVGDVVEKGQRLALVGSTGRSTGPHVHFEVYKNGRVVDPAAYIQRTDR